MQGLIQLQTTEDTEDLLGTWNWEFGTGNMSLSC
jgi:hypothetical protein